MEELKKQIEKFIKEEISKGTRKQNIEIELLHFIKKTIYSD